METQEPNTRALERMTEPALPDSDVDDSQLRERTIETGAQDVAVDEYRVDGPISVRDLADRLAKRSDAVYRRISRLGIEAPLSRTLPNGGKVSLLTTEQATAIARSFGVVPGAATTADEASAIAVQSAQTRSDARVTAQLRPSESENQERDGETLAALVEAQQQLVDSLNATVAEARESAATARDRATAAEERERVGAERVAALELELSEARAEATRLRSSWTWFMRMLDALGPWARLRRRWPKDLDEIAERDSDANAAQ